MTVSVPPTADRPSQDDRAVVIVPHHDDESRLVRCLAALDLPHGIECIVVDNGSPRDPADAVARFPGVRLLHEPAPGAAMARNRGVAETTAPILLFLDADCVPGPGWAAHARATVQAARRDGADPVIGGAVEVFHEGDGPLSGAQAFEAVFAFDFRDYIERQGFSGAGNLATTRRAFDATGPFRATVSEDRDWTMRAVAAGFPLRYDDAMRVGHPSRGDWAALRRKWRRLTDEGYALHRAQGRSRLRWAGRALLMPPSVLAHMPRVLRHPRIAGTRGRALATLARLRLLRMAWMLRQAAGRDPSSP